MRKLLHADLARLGKDKIFRLILLISLVVTFFASVPNPWNTLGYGGQTIYVEDVMFQLIPYLPFLCALLTSLYLGPEFEENTIRNKFIVGYTRFQVFFSAYLTCMTASLVLLAGMLLCGGVIGELYYGAWLFPGAKASWMVLCCILVTMVFSAICVAFLMNIPRKPAIFLTLCFLVMLYVASYLGSRLDAQEMTYDGVTITAEGGVQFGNLIPNPAYVSGTTRKIFELLYDLLPTGQTIQLNNREFDRCLRWAPMSVIVLAVSTVAGFLPFRKRDLR